PAYRPTPAVLSTTLVGNWTSSDVRRFEGFEFDRVSGGRRLSVGFGWVKPSPRWREARMVRREVSASQGSRRGRSAPGSREQPSAECHRRGEAAPKPKSAPGIGLAGGATSAESASHSASANQAPAAASGPRGRKMQAQQYRRR